MNCINKLTLAIFNFTKSNLLEWTLNDVINVKDIGIWYFSKTIWSQTQICRYDRSRL